MCAGHGNLVKYEAYNYKIVWIFYAIVSLTWLGTTKNNLIDHISVSNARWYQ